MKKIILCAGFILFITGLFYIEALGSVPVKDIYCDGNYIEDVIYSRNQDGDGWTEYQIYKYSLKEAGRVDLHFISHITDILSVKVKDSDENVLASESVEKQYSPLDIRLYLPSGVYYIYISTYYSSTAGDYKFKLDFQPTPISSNILTVGKTYTGLFESAEKYNDESQQVELYLENKGEYDVSLKSDMYLECNFKTADEDIIETLWSYDNGPYRERIELPNGKIIVEFCAYGSSGFYELTIFPKNKPVIEQTENIKSDAQDKQWTDRFLSSSKFIGILIVLGIFGGILILNKLLSPSTFIGALIVAIVAGVLVDLILRFI